MNPFAVIPAAGSSSRMRGRDKLLEKIEGVPLLRRQAGIAIDSGCEVAVALPKDGVARREAIGGLAVTMIEVEDAAKGPRCHAPRCHPACHAICPGSRHVDPAAGRSWHHRIRHQERH